MRLLLYLDDIASEYFHIFESYRTRGDALTLMSNSRQLSHEASLKEDADFRAEQLATNGFLAPKQEELSVENLYHTIRANRSAQTSANSSQTLMTNSVNLLHPSDILNAVNSPDLFTNLLPLIQKGIQQSNTTSLRPTNCFGTNENNVLVASALKIEQPL